MDFLVPFYETTLDHDWNMTPIDRSLDLSKVSSYLSRFQDSIDRAFIQELLNKTTYIYKEKVNQETNHIFISPIV